ncbi:hypothetical protein DFH09DRAFT_1285517 [Mycena vulgaris]|nr:hypothetical protein DFH09DRAFT_1285517 [Mycena vulgaris]
MSKQLWFKPGALVVPHRALEAVPSTSPDASSLRSPAPQTATADTSSLPVSSVVHSLTAAYPPPLLAEHADVHAELDQPGVRDSRVDVVASVLYRRGCHVGVFRGHGGGKKTRRDAQYVQGGGLEGTRITGGTTAIGRYMLLPVTYECGKGAIAFVTIWGVFVNVAGGRRIGGKATGFGEQADIYSPRPFKLCWWAKGDRQAAVSGRQERRVQRNLACSARNIRLFVTLGLEPAWYTLRDRPRPGSRVAQKFEPDPEPAWARLRVGPWVGPRSPGLGRA